MIDISKCIIYISGADQNEKEDIKKCLTALYSVRKGEQPLDRNFGLDQDFLDQPIPVSKNMLALEITEKTQIYEKRVTVERVDYESGEEGSLYPGGYL